MVRPQPPGPEVVHHADKHNLDFDGRHTVKHFLSNIHSHDQLDNLLNIHGNVNNACDDEHDNVHLNKVHLPIVRRRTAGEG